MPPVGFYNSVVVIRRITPGLSPVYENPTAVESNVLCLRDLGGGLSDVRFSRPRSLESEHRTDLSDDAESIVDPHFDAKARPQQGSTVEIRSRRSFAAASREVPFKLSLRP